MNFSFNNLFIWDQILIKTKKIISHFEIYWGQKFKNEPIWLVQTIYFNLHELAYTYALVADFFISFTTGKMVSRTSSRVFNNHRLINLHHFCCCPLKKIHSIIIFIFVLYTIFTIWKMIILGHISLIINNYFRAFYLHLQNVWLAIWTMHWHHLESFLYFW